MPYPALPDHRIPYDNDGTLAYWGNMTIGAATAITNAQLIEMQDDDYADSGIATVPVDGVLFLFFPHQSEVTGLYYRTFPDGPANAVSGSNDTTNGLDGTWETASMPGGFPGHVDNFSWRSDIKAISFTGPKKNVRIAASIGGQNIRPAILHLFGEAAAGQMAHDLVFLDPDLGSGVAFPGPENFGDQPLGTSVVRPFRVKNTSASRTATNVNIQCNDPDFTIGESSSGPWVVTINVASLAPGAESATFHVRCTTPAPGAPLKPRFARILATCDSGFFG